ncbi:MAG: triphosphoribosyl-dephospho-CoA synthase CitG [Clostridium sp.]
MVEDDFIFRIIEIAGKSILYEVSTYPSPGLVSPVSTGSHKDMDFYTFIDSALCLNKYFYNTCKVSLKENMTPKDIFKELRVIGKDAEKDMLDRTNGVNTHKGMIFLMIITISAVVNTIKNKNTFYDIRNYIKELTEDLVENDFKGLKSKKSLTYGEKIYIKYGLKGIRGEVAEGLPSVFNTGLKVYESNYNMLDKRRNIVNTLIAIMSVSEDTTLLHRHDIKVLEYIQKTSKYIMDIGGVTTKEGEEYIQKLDDELSLKGISPGGSADLLAITIFLSEIKKAYFSKQKKNN